MSDQLLAFGLLVGSVALLFFGPRLIGMGRCMRCSAGIAPWDAYCWKHSPSNPREEEWD